MAAAPVFEFDRFELDVGGYELRRGGQKVRLQHVPMDLLILLIERRGSLVTREEIVARVWNGDALVDSQSSINTAIRKIRQALDDDGEQPRFVETVIGKGYRFIGEVSTRLPAQEEAIAPPVQPEFPAATAQRWRALLPFAAIAAVVVIGAAVLFSFRRTPQSREPMTIVPFTAVPGPQSWPAFSPDGNRVAFGWTGGAGECSHIYVKTVGGNMVGGGPVKLTDSGDCDSSPSWSHDGRWIAFSAQAAGRRSRRLRHTGRRRRRAQSRGRERTQRLSARLGTRWKRACGHGFRASRCAAEPVPGGGRFRR